MMAVLPLLRYANVEEVGTWFVQLPLRNQLPLLAPLQVVCAKVTPLVLRKAASRAAAVIHRRADVTWTTRADWLARLENGHGKAMRLPPQITVPYHACNKSFRSGLHDVDC